MENHPPNIDSAQPDKACQWCGKPLPPRLNIGGLTKRYCSNACRHSIHFAARLWAMRAIDAYEVADDNEKALGFLYAFQAKCIRRILNISHSYWSRISNDQILHIAQCILLSVELHKHQIEIIGSNRDEE